MSKIVHRRQPLLQPSHHSRKAVTRLGEAVGGAAAVCCCCPCGVANIIFLAIYKLPVSLCRQALKKKKKQQRRHEGRLPATRRCGCACGYCDDVSFRVHPMCGGGGDDEREKKVVVDDESFVEEEDKEVVALEMEMWDRFYSTGFWRSSSQKESSFSSSLSSSEWIVDTVSVPNFQVVAA